MSGGEFLSGMRTAVPSLIATAPFGLLVGAMAIENGLSVGQAVLMSTVLFAGASQLVGIELFAGGVAPWLVLLSIVAVNFRMLLYSAGITRHVARWSLPRRLFSFHFVTDAQFAEIERRVDSGESISYAWYLGMGLSFLVAWVLETWLGAVFGRLIENPMAFGFDFLVSIYFLGIVMSFRARPGWLPIVIASALGSLIAYRLIGSPWHILMGAAAGIAAGILRAPGEAPAQEPIDV